MSDRVVRMLGPFVLILLAATIAPAEEARVGQIVCSNCWFEADRNRVPYGTEGDLACAARCAKRAIPVALAVKDGDAFELFELRGNPGDAAEDWLPLVSRFARVTGETFDLDEGRGLRVASVELLDESPWPAPESSAADLSALSWTDLGGHAQSLQALHGRIVVLNFWATWCAPCRKEMPDLVRIQNEFGMYGVQVVGAAADWPDQRETVLEFARKQKINFPLVLGATSAQMEGLGLGVALPATAIIDRAGNVVRRYRGVIDRKVLGQALQELIDGTLEDEPHHDEHGHGGARSAGDAEGHVRQARHTSHASLVPS